MKVLIICLLFVLAVFLPQKAKAQVNVQDSLALIALYNSTDGPNWTIPWPITLPIEYWPGVYLQNNRVVQLFVEGYGLSGIIPTEIGNLTELTYLSLSQNNLSGNIPVELFNLVNLEVLHLYENQLQGEIPHEIGNLINLQALSLHDNFLMGELPVELYQLTNLMILNIMFNSFSGDITTGIYSMINLQTLSIGNNLFSNLPDLTLLCSNHLNTLGCNDNLLTFEDLEQNVMNTWQHIQYSPQDSILNNIDTLVDVGTSVSFSSLVGGSQNHYQWYKDTVVQQGDTSETLTLNNISFADSGIYTCHITNSIVPNLTLIRKNVVIHVKDTSSVTICPPDNDGYYIVAPNPSSGEINITPGNFRHLEITNCSGIVVCSITGKPCKTELIDISDLSAGVYFLKIETNGEVITRKVIKTSK